jgi:hypothetical protein
MEHTHGLLVTAILMLTFGKWQYNVYSISIPIPSEFVTSVYLVVSIIPVHLHFSIVNILAHKLIFHPLQKTENI